MNSTEGIYESEERRTIAEVEGLRVRQLALGQDQSVPWHLHTQITDTFFCMQGPMQVHTRRPTQLHVLKPGESVAVAPDTPHYVIGVDGRPCRFMLVQGVGTYDYVPVEVT